MVWAWEGWKEVVLRSCRYGGKEGGESRAVLLALIYLTQ